MTLESVKSKSTDKNKDVGWWFKFCALWISVKVSVRNEFIVKSWIRHDFICHLKNIVYIDFSKDYYQQNCFMLKEFEPKPNNFF